MSNPFENPDGDYLVLVNAEFQHSLWPAFAEVPDGWEVAYGKADRAACLEYVTANWTDLRPKSLIERMANP
ncbi:MbtH family protein [Amycolatopsis anabasis]|uniref:MbtH family protein n=1 Tax=Amycolatopsis anabasis TaxID=1840409 RepID=UPI00131A93AF|nr:MbtH family protein [Amycolatopsis anabasis]